MDDAADLLRWRNNEQSRLQSRNVAEVDLEDHLRWLAHVLGDPDRRLLIAECNGRKVGSVRLDSGPTGEEWSWSLAPEIRGRGLGRLMLAAATEASRQRPCLAWIRRDNIASERIAAATGFALTAEADTDLRLWRLD